MARIIFMGTPDYARTILQHIWRAEDQILVVTKPDRPQGRGRQMTASSVAEWANAQHLTVYKPERMKDGRVTFEEFRPDWILTAAYGKILPRWLLALPRLGAYNLHASLLPRWRGPNPIAWAIRAQDRTTGVTLMAMDEGIDTGPIVSQKAMPIGEHDDVESLTERLAVAAADLWNETRAAYGEASFELHSQSEQGITYAEKFTAEAGRIDWTVPAERVGAVIRSVLPSPGAYSFFQGVRMNIVAARPEPGMVEGGPGTIVPDGQDWLVAAGTGRVRITIIRPAGKRAMSPADYVRGLRGNLIWILE